MSDSADELILKMQHLEAQAKESQRARAATSGLERLKTATQKLAWEAKKEIATFEKQLADSERTIDQLREGGVTPSEAPEFVAARNSGEEAKKQLIKANARFNFALDQMSEIERREFEAFHAEARAETHGQMAEDPLCNKP
jgi:hypothetical protein